MNIKISSELKSYCPNMALGVIGCNIVNSKHQDGLWQLIDNEIKIIKQKYDLENLKFRDEIAATRQAYKATGKDPNRYRPSAEALCRRILRNMELYHISTAVDVINFISIKSGFSIGGFDAGRIQGDLVARIGIDNEPFEAIGRGSLNIEGLPVLHDETGAIGTPTSDVVRTSLQLNTRELLININAYRGKNSLFPTIDEFIFILKTYLCAEQIEVKIIS